MVGKILIPTDFSKTSRHAFRYAVSLNGTLKARLFLLHVINDFADLTEYSLSLSFLPQIYSELEQTATLKLEEMVTDMVPSDMHCDTFILHGIPFYEIVSFALSEQMDLIVMGSHGHTGLKHVLFGHTAEKVVKKAHCPVLTVKDPDCGLSLP